MSFKITFKDKGDHLQIQQTCGRCGKKDTLSFHRLYTILNHISNEEERYKYGFGWKLFRDFCAVCCNPQSKWESIVSNARFQLMNLYKYKNEKIKQNNIEEYNEKD